MSWFGRRTTSDRLRSLEHLLDQVDRRLERIETVTLVREPNTQVAADAYNGLRKQLIAAANERMAHLVQLAQLDSVLQAGIVAHQLSELVQQWMEHASLAVVPGPGTDTDDAFEVVGPGTGDELVARRPAYVDRVTGRIVKQGVAEWVQRAPDYPPRDDRAAQGAHDPTVGEGEGLR